MSTGGTGFQVPGSGASDPSHDPPTVGLSQTDASVGTAMTPAFTAKGSQGKQGDGAEARDSSPQMSSPGESRLLRVGGWHALDPPLSAELPPPSAPLTLPVGGLMTWMDWQSLHIRVALPELANALICGPTVCVCVSLVPLQALWPGMSSRTGTVLVHLVLLSLSNEDGTR